MPEVAEEMLAASLIFLPMTNYYHLKMKNKVKLNHRFTKVSRYFTTVEFVCQRCQLFAEFFLPCVFFWRKKPRYKSVKLFLVFKKETNWIRLSRKETKE